MPSCSAGDVRFRYEVQDPADVSVLGRVGEVVGRGEAKAAVSIALILPKAMPNGIGLGLVHSGLKSASQIIGDEDSKSRRRAVPSRFLLILRAIVFSHLLVAPAGRDIGGDRTTTAPSRIMATLEIWIGTLVSVRGDTLGSVGVRTGDGDRDGGRRASDGDGSEARSSERCARRPLLRLMRAGTVGRGSAGVEGGGFLPGVRRGGGRRSRRCLE